MVQSIKGNPFLSQNRPNTYINPNQRVPNLSSNRQPQINQFNDKPRTNTPPNYRNNLLEYILSPKGQGMAQGLLEASGYSTKPVSFGEALSRGMGRSTEAQRYADQIAFRDKQYQDEKAFRDQQTAFQNLMAEKTFGLETDKFGLSERKFLSEEERDLLKIGLTEEQINNAKQNNIDLLAFKNKKFTSDERLALLGLGLQEKQIDNLENYRTKSLEFQEKKFTSDEKISLARLGIDERRLELQGTDINNRYEIGLKNIGLKEKDINSIIENRKNTFDLEKDKLDFSKEKFSEETKLALRKLGQTDTQIANAEKYNARRLDLQEKGIDLQQLEYELKKEIANYGNQPKSRDIKIAELVGQGLPRNEARDIVDGLLQINTTDEGITTVFNPVTKETNRYGTPITENSTGSSFLDPKDLDPKTISEEKINVITTEKIIPKIKNISAKANDIFGTLNKIKDIGSGVAGIMPPSIDKFLIDPDVVQAKKEYGLVKKELELSLTNNPRFPVAEVQRILELLPDEKSFLQDPQAASIALNTIANDIQNKLDESKSILTGTKVTTDVMQGSGVSLDPFMPSTNEDFSKIKSGQYFIYNGELRIMK